MVEPDYKLDFDVEKIRDVIEPNDGYTWVYYDPQGMDSKHEKNGKIWFKCYERNTHRLIVVEVKNFPSTLWHRVGKSSEIAKTGMVDAYGMPVVQESFDNVAARRKWVNAWKKHSD